MMLKHNDNGMKNLLSKLFFSNITQLTPKYTIVSDREAQLLYFKLVSIQTTIKSLHDIFSEHIQEIVNDISDITLVHLYVSDQKSVVKSKEDHLVYEISEYKTILPLYVKDDPILGEFKKNCDDFLEKFSLGYYKKNKSFVNAHKKIVKSVDELVAKGVDPAQYKELLKYINEVLDILSKFHQTLEKLSTNIYAFRHRHMEYENIIYDLFKINDKEQ